MLLDTLDGWSIWVYENSEKGNCIVVNAIRDAASVTSNVVRSWSLTETCDKMRNECQCIWILKHY